MRFIKGLVLSAILIILVFAGSASALPEHGTEDTNKPEAQAYGLYSAVSTDLLRQYEPDYRNFKGVRIADRIVYFKQRTIGEAIVQRNYIAYHFDKDTKELVDMRMRWRVGLPAKLPRIISRKRAESMVEGEIRFSQLYYISPESDVFPIEPTPENPCWVVEALNNGNVTVTVIDAVEGKILGPGVPPPYTAFSLTGPHEWDHNTCTCNGKWRKFYENARDWFDTMGHSTEAVQWPTEDKVKSHIQSNETAMFYEIAHGGSESFGAACYDVDCRAGGILASDIEAWIADYEKMPFTFIGSCGGMCDIGDDTLSYEFRKGSNEYTATVGYCGMGEQPCEDSCWYAGYPLPWQTALFEYMNQNWTVKAAFDQANMEYPGCAVYGCMRFAGDVRFAAAQRERSPDEIDYALAYAPMPPDYGIAVADMNEQIMLSWRPGGYVGDPNGHDVYFGESFDDVNQATRAVPLGVYKGVQNYADLDYGSVDVQLDKTYYWRIDEIDDANGDSPWKGDVWTLDVQNYLIVDEFELYNGTGSPHDEADPNLRDTWDDFYAGIDDYYSAAIIYLERGIKKGAKSMKLDYNNDGTSGPAYYSETWRTYDPCQDWTTGGVKAIALSFYGDIGNTVYPDENLYVLISDGTTEKAVDCDCEPSDLLIPVWQECNIVLEDFTGVDMNEVDKVAVGIGNSSDRTTGDDAGGEGTVYIDNIRLYQTRCVLKYAQREDLSGDCITDYKDLDIMTDDWLIGDYNLVLGLVGRYQFEDGPGSSIAADTSGKGHHGTLVNMNTATCWVADPCRPGSYELEFDPNANSPCNGLDFVRLPVSDDFALIEKGVTYATWIKTNDMTGGLLNELVGPRMIRRGDPCIPEASSISCELELWYGIPVFHCRYGENNALYAGCPAPGVADGTWHHVAATIEFNVYGDDTDLVKLYLDGTAGGDPNAQQARLDFQENDDPNYVIDIASLVKGTKPPTKTSTLDDVQIYNRPLSGAEIETVKNGGTAPDKEMYFPPGRDNIPSLAELYSEESEGDRIVNFRDYAFLVDDWLEETIWP